MRILFVALADNVHTVRWISQLRGLGWDLHLMPSIQAMQPHTALRDVTLHDLFRHPRARYDPSLRQSAVLPFSIAKGRTRAQRLLDRVSGGRLGAAGRLASLVRRLRPDVVHSMETQSAGYLAAQSRERYLRSNGTGGPPFPFWILSCWGNDLYYYGNLPDHAARLRQTLSSCDGLVADCRRDVPLARDLGFAGRFTEVFPTAGGYDLRAMRAMRAAGAASSRRVIAIKGYHGEHHGSQRFGRGLFAVRAIRLCADAVKSGSYEVVVYSWAHGSPVVSEGEAVARETGVKFTFLPYSPHDEIVRLMGRARVAVALNISDGTPNAMLEAMVMGAFPVQSDTVSTGEWIENGINGRLVPPEDAEAVAAALRAALVDDALIDRAAEVNARVTAERIDTSVVRPAVIAMYERAVGRGR